MGKWLKKRKSFGFIFVALTAIFFFLFSCRKKDQGETPSAAAMIHDPSQHETQQEKKEEKPSEKKALYQCPMHPDYTSDKPGSCPICGMTLVAVKEEPLKKEMEMGEGAVMISPEKQQLIGVTFGSVEYRNLEKAIRTVGRLAYDETKLADINTKFSGWIEKLYVNYTGQLVRRGEPLFALYSPELVSAQEEYLLALKAKGYFEDRTGSGASRPADSVVEAARRKLLYFDISEAQIKDLEISQKPQKNMLFYAPFTGFVIEKHIVQGKSVMPGESLYKLADISRIWVLADAYESDLPYVSRGLEATVELPYFPGEKLAGKIAYIYPYLENETRTVKVRIEVANPDFKLKPEMYGTVQMKINLGQKLTVPATAVLDSGTRKLIFIAEGEGHFEPREVRLGARAGDYYEVLEGAKDGDRVVTSANFLIDSESKLKLALQGAHKH